MHSRVHFDSYITGFGRASLSSKYNALRCTNYADGIPNSKHSDQTPLESSWSKSTLFAQIYLSQNLDFFRKYIPDWLVSESEFLDSSTGWPSFYGDTQAISEEFFDNLNIHCIPWLQRFWPAFAGCGFIGPRDLLEHRDNMDSNGMQEAGEWMPKSASSLA